MTELVLDFGKFSGKEEVHDRIREKLNFPEYYGKNLDALYDLLSVRTEPLKVYLFPCGSAFEAGFTAVFQDLAEENTAIILEICELPK